MYRFFSKYCWSMFTFQNSNQVSVNCNCVCGVRRLDCVCVFYVRLHNIYSILHGGPWILLVCTVFQVLFHLTQLTSATLNPRRPCSPLASATKSSRSQGPGSHTEGDFDIICPQSLNTVGILVESACDCIIKRRICDVFVLFSGCKQLQWIYFEKFAKK